MGTSFPTGLDSFATAVDNTTDVMAADINDARLAIEALEVKMGINSSAVTASIDYILKHTSSANPGHKHTLANSATDVTATAAEINASLDGCTATDTEINTACDGDAAKNNHVHDSGDLDTKLIPVANESIQGTEYSTTSTSWTTVVTYPIYIPDNAQKLYGRFRIHASSSEITYIRVKVGIATSAGVNDSGSDTYVWVTDGACDVSGLAEGWSLLEIQINGTYSVAKYLQGFSVNWGS